MKVVVAIVALSLAYAVLTWPIVRRLERRMHRVAAIALVDSAAAVVLAALGFAFAPLIFSQTQAIVEAVPLAGAKLALAIPASAQWWFSGLAATMDVNLASYTRDLFGVILTVIRSVTAFVGAAIVIPILAAYFQLDAQRYYNALLALVPAGRHAQTRAAIAEISRTAGGVVRGQVIVSSLVGVLVYVVLAAMGIPFAGLIAIATAICDLVPYLGGIVAFLPSLLFALTFGGVARAAIVGILLLAVFEFEAQLLAPQIVGANTRLAPSLIVVALLTGTALFGVLGLFLAVPVTALVAAGIRGFMSLDKDGQKS
jgi:predicted PurR-regulated permease PerM